MNLYLIYIVKSDNIINIITFNYYDFVFGLNITAIKYPNTIAAVIPPAVPVIPPVKAPTKPFSFTALIAPLAREFPNPGKGIVAPDLQFQLPYHIYQMHQE